MENCINLAERSETGLSRAGVKAGLSIVLLTGILLSTEMIPEFNVKSLGKAGDPRILSEEAEKPYGVLKPVVFGDVPDQLCDLKEFDSSQYAEELLYEISENAADESDIPDVIIPEPEMPDVILPGSGDIPEVPDSAADEDEMPEIPNTGAGTENPEVSDGGTSDEGMDSPAEVTNGFLIDDEGMICGMDATALSVPDGYLELPGEGCVGIRSGALVESGIGIKEVYIPENISVIEEGAFANLYQLEWIETAMENPGYVSVDGVLFDAGMTTLLAFPGGWTDTYIVPEGVVRLAGNAFAETSVSCIDMWMCGPIEAGEAIFGSHGGNGIEIKAPLEYAQMYQEVFAGYSVRFS